MIRTFNPFRVWFLQPTHEDILREQLRAAQCDRADHAKNAEYHDAMTKMLDKRIARIKRELPKESAQ